MKDFKAVSLLALVILALTITAYLKTYNADYVPVTDIKADQVDEVDGDIKFYCETDFK